MPSVVPSPRPLTPRRAGALAALALLLASLGTALLASPAAAHNTLRSTDPADGSTVATAPAQVTLTFDQPALELGTQIVVTGPDGVAVSDGPVQLVDVSVVQPLVTTLPAGTYDVAWRVTSADGHPLTGAFTFTATEPVGVPAPAEEPTDASEPTDAAATTAEATPAAEPSDPASPTEEVVATPISAEPAQDGLPAWAWAGLAVAVLAAGGMVALLVSRRGLDGASGTGTGAGAAPGPDPTTDPSVDPTTDPTTGPGPGGPLDGPPPRA
ncbi:copper resistance CopC family protein [Cellulomonas phragmiteti]|uniref:CopC domain-containing protein n=1 Tax=Cellulomonas phragmiteti TaxID=478780 RepID=A0ABQ4DQK1_9CELL|nr:copper resistance CopC family protein [Cellulomonas phragmiteti]GIG41614.1 hypothetical protein Cph01nite_33760 [Cellulomonas phragmiteti]